MGWDKDSIKELRKKLQLTQCEFAEMLGCRQQTISEWEVGLYSPANAYGKLLDQFAKGVRFQSTPTILPPNLSQILKQLEEPEEAVVVNELPVTSSPSEGGEDRPFDPAID